MDTLQFMVTTRYISAMTHANLVTSPLATATGTDATWYTDLAARYDFTDNMSLRLGVNNVANQQPRLYAPNIQANTDPSSYDVLGRRYFVGFDWRM
jgi:outer membrane receptor protein involved in Fe transport